MWSLNLICVLLCLVNCIKGSPSPFKDEFYDSYDGSFEDARDINNGLVDHPDYDDVEESEYPQVCNYDGNNPNPADCSGYFVCANGEVKRLETCPIATQFSVKEKKCISQVGLEKGETMCQKQKDSRKSSKFEDHVYRLSPEDIEESKVVTRDPLCVHLEGLNANSDAQTRKERCTKYVECRNGRLYPTRQDCPPGLTYDAEYRQCVYPKENTNSECRALDSDTKRLESFCYRRLREGRFQNGQTQLFRSVKLPCQIFIICSTTAEHGFGSCPVGKSFHPLKKQCLKHNEVPDCKRRGYIH